MAVTAFAIPAALMIPVAPAAQPGNTKIAPPSLKGSAKPLEFDVPASAEPFHALMQISSETGEVPKAKTSKRNASSNLAAAAPTATPSKEYMPPAVLTLPQTPAPLDPMSAPAITPTLMQVFGHPVMDFGHGHTKHLLAADPGLAPVSSGGEIRNGTSQKAYLGSPRREWSADPVGIAASDKTTKALPRETARALGGAQTLPHDQPLPHHVSQVLAKTKVQTVAQGLPQTLSKASTDRKPTAGPAGIAKSSTAPATAGTLRHDQASPHQVSQTFAQARVQSIGQDLPQTSSNSSIGSKPADGPVGVAKSSAAPTVTAALDDPRPALSGASGTPIAVIDEQTPDFAIEASLPPTPPAEVVVQDGNPAPGIFGQAKFASDRESSRGDSYAPRPATAPAFAHKHSDHQRERQDSQAGVTTAAEPLKTIPEVAQHVEPAPRSEPAPLNGPIPQSEPAPHKESAPHGGPELSSTKSLMAPPAAPPLVTASALTPVPATELPGGYTASVPNVIPPAFFGDMQTSKVSFEADLRLMPQVQAATPEISRTPRTLQQQPMMPERSSQQASGASRPTSGGPPADKHSGDKHDDSQRELPELQEKSSTSAAASPTPAETASHAEPSRHAETELSPSTNLLAAPITPHTPAAASASTPVAAPLPSHAPVAGAETTPAADHVSAPSAANDIKIALNDNGQRVELRVTERAGDIHVTVRTPDSQLATAMREDLPALSSRLEQSGFQSEMWHPAASTSSESRAIEVSSGSGAYESREQHGGRQSQEDPQQNHRNPQQTLIRKSDRKEFSWLLESIR
jgi:hypothetical protein